MKWFDSWFLVCCLYIQREHCQWSFSISCGLYTKNFVFTTSAFITDAWFFKQSSNFVNCEMWVINLSSFLIGIAKIHVLPIWYSNFSRQDNQIRFRRGSCDVFIFSNNHISVQKEEAIAPFSGIVTHSCHWQWCHEEMMWSLEREHRSRCYMMVTKKYLSQQTSKTLGESVNIYIYNFLVFTFLLLRLQFIMGMTKK